MNTVEINTTAGNTVEINTTAGNTVELITVDQLIVGNQNDAFPYYFDFKLS